MNVHFDSKLGGQIGYVENPGILSELQLDNGPYKIWSSNQQRSF